MRLFEVEENARYIAIVEMPVVLRSSDAEETTKKVIGYLDQWWDSGQRFGCLIADAGCHLRLERVETK